MSAWRPFLFFCPPWLKLKRGMPGLSRERFRWELVQVLLFSLFYESCRHETGKMQGTVSYPMPHMCMIKGMREGEERRSRPESVKQSDSRRNPPPFLFDCLLSVLNALNPMPWTPHVCASGVSGFVHVPLFPGCRTPPWVRKQVSVPSPLTQQ